MLSYLLDENLSPVIARELTAKEPELKAVSIHRWRGGGFVGQPDERILRAAHEENLTLVTYDLKTIPPLLNELAADNESHGGVLFIDDATLRSDDFGGLVRALLAHWHKYHAEDWHNRVGFLPTA